MSDSLETGLRALIGVVAEQPVRLFVERFRDKPIVGSEVPFEIDFVHTATGVVYRLRPVISNERLTRLPDARIRLALKRPRPDGATHSATPVRVIGL